MLPIYHEDVVYRSSRFSLHVYSLSYGVISRAAVAVVMAATIVIGDGRVNSAKPEPDASYLEYYCLLIVAVSKQQIR